MKKFNRVFTILIFIFLYVPMAVLIVASFDTGKSLAGFEGFTMQQYVRLFKDRTLLKLLGNSILLSVLASSIATVFGTVAAVGINGLRGMVLPEATATPAGWEKDVRPEIPASRRVIWEVNVRDFSSDPASGIRMSWRGKYLGLTQDGTTLNWDGVHPTGLAHLKRLGITYVQIMPMYDFGSVDESRISSGKYNWGYEPANFNVPEGS